MNAINIKHILELDEEQTAIAKQLETLRKQRKQLTDQRKKLHTALAQNQRQIRALDNEIFNVQNQYFLTNKSIEVYE